MESFEEVYQKYLKEVYCFSAEIIRRQGNSRRTYPADICHCI